MKQKNNMKGTWKILNEVLRGTSITSKIPDTFLDGNKEIHSKKDIADGFNNFFINVGPNLASGIQKSVNKRVIDYLEDPNGSTMYLDPVNEMEIVNIVRAFGKKTSLDCYGMNMALIKQIIVPIVKPFAHICNLSFSSGVFPELMKVAKVVPLFKSGEKMFLQIIGPYHCYRSFQKY